ncbi:MAG: TonB-dependent receptor domain-containing protein [Terriglobia bacterium]
MNKRRSRVILICGLAFCLSVSVLENYAQSPEGILVGVVLDSSGARIPGADVAIQGLDSKFSRQTTTDPEGEFRVAPLPPGRYQIKVSAGGFAPAEYEINIAVSSMPTLSIVLKPASLKQSVSVIGEEYSLASQPIETTSSVEKSTVTARDLAALPLAHRSFANIAYLSPMTQPVEPSDPTKARITAVSFAGSSGLNVDLSVDGGDNNDDYIGGFLQNYSPDAIQDFAIRTAQFDADTSRTNGGSVIIASRRGTEEWHGSLGFYERSRSLNARNGLDNPDPNPKQPFSRQNGVATLGGPVQKGRIWFFSSLEYVRENASVAYSADSLSEFRNLATLANRGLIPGVSSIDVPTSVLVPFRDTLFSTRMDWSQSEHSQWLFRGAFDRSRVQNDLVQQATLPSTGATTRSNYFSFLVSNQFQLPSNWTAVLTMEASEFHHTKQRNSQLGLALAFPFSATFHTTSGFETFGDNQFVTPITAFPIQRDQQKYQVRYDVHHTARDHTFSFGVNLIHEPVLRGRLADDPELLVVFPNDPSFYLSNPAQFSSDLLEGSTNVPGGNGSFSQSIRRLGLYLQDSWHLRPHLTFNLGLRYDTTFGLFRAEGRLQDQNPAITTLNALGIALSPGIPHDYRRAFAPRLGLAYSPGNSASTVIRAGVGLYFNDLSQNGWVNAFQAVNTPGTGLLGPGEQGAVIDPSYHTPYALEASVGIEHAFHRDWRVNIQYEHHQGVHQYRRYEYVAGSTLPAEAPNISLFRTDNRSRYDGVSFMVQHRMSTRFELTAHYTFASASTWGATVGELFDYVNGVSDVRNAFGPGDHGPSGEDVRHRLVIAGTLRLPFKLEMTTLSQFESARPYTLSTPVDLNGDGLDSNDRAVVNGVQTALDQFRGAPFAQIDLRVSREFGWGEHVAIRPFVEFFNLLNRSNPGNNFVSDLSALPVPASQLGNATSLCTNAACTATRPIAGLNDLRVPAGALGDFFGPGTTVGIPFAAQLGIRITF